MNKLIQELLLQAREQTKEGKWNAPTVVWAEKFADLIVEECVSQCWTVSELESKGFVVSECSKRIRKHFGVN